MSQRITIEIKDKIATCLTTLPVVCGNSDYVIDFLFDEEWNKHNIKTATFVVNGAIEYRVFNGTVCEMPVFQDTLVALVGVFAGTIDDGTLSTSTPAIVRCRKCVTDGDSVPTPPKDDVYNQIIELLDELTRSRIQADWKQKDESQPNFIKNKPFSEEREAELKDDGLFYSRYTTINPNAKSVVLDDILPIPQTVRVKVSQSDSGQPLDGYYFGNNMCFKGTPRTENGLTIAVDEDGTYHISGTATKDFSIRLCKFISPVDDSWRFVDHLQGTFPKGDLEYRTILTSTNPSYPDDTRTWWILCDDKSDETVGARIYENEIVTIDLFLFEGLTYDFTLHPVCKIADSFNEIPSRDIPCGGGKISLPNGTTEFELENSDSEMHICFFSDHIIEAVEYRPVFGEGMKILEYIDWLIEQYIEILDYYDALNDEIADNQGKIRELANHLENHAPMKKGSTDLSVVGGDIDKNKATGKGAVAFGYSGTRAKGNGAFVAGLMDTAAYPNGVRNINGVDYEVGAIGAAAVSMGGSNIASQDAAASFGAHCASLAKRAFSGGHHTWVLPGHEDAIALGKYLCTGAKWQAIFGAYNKPNVNAIFQLGDGTGSGTGRANAFEVGKTDTGEYYLELGNTRLTLGEITALKDIASVTNAEGGSF